MRPARRDVRFTRDFFLDLARQLPERRGLAGQPSRIDFETHDLQMIVGRFAADWDDLPELIPGRADYRVLISVGVRSAPSPWKASWPPTARSNWSG